MFINRLIKTFQERGRPDPEDVCFPCCIAAGFSPERKQKRNYSYETITKQNAVDPLKTL